MNTKYWFSTSQYCTKKLAQSHWGKRGSQKGLGNDGFPFLQRISTNNSSAAFQVYHYNNGMVGKERETGGRTTGMPWSGGWNRSKAQKDLHHLQMRMADGLEWASPEYHCTSLKRVLTEACSVKIKVFETITTVISISIYYSYICIRCTTWCLGIYIVKSLSYFFYFKKKLKLNPLSNVSRYHIYND